MRVAATAGPIVGLPARAVPVGVVANEAVSADTVAEWAANGVGTPYVAPGFAPAPPPLPPTYQPPIGGAALGGGVARLAAQNRFNAHNFATQPVVALCLRDVEDAILNIPRIADITLVEAPHYRALLIAERARLDAVMQTALTLFNAHPFLHLEPVIARRRGNVTIALAVAGMHGYPAEVEAHYRALLTTERVRLDAVMYAAQLYFDAHDFDAEPVIETRRDNVNAAGATIGTHGYPPEVEAHYRALLTTEKDRLNDVMYAAQLYFDAHDFDAEPVIETRRGQVVAALMAAGTHGYTPEVEAHYRALLTDEQTWLNTVMQTALTHFQRHNFNLEPVITTRRDNVNAALAAAGTLDYGLDIEAYYVALLTAEQARLDAVMQTALTHFQGHNFDLEPVITTRRHNVHAALMAAGTLGYAPEVTTHYRVLLTAEQARLDVSINAAVARFNGHNFAGAYADDTLRRQAVDAAIVGIAGLAIADPNEAAHYYTLLTVERARLDRMIAAVAAAAAAIAATTAAAAAARPIRAVDQRTADQVIMNIMKKRR